MRLSRGCIQVLTFRPMDPIGLAFRVRRRVKNTPKPRLTCNLITPARYPLPGLRSYPGTATPQSRAATDIRHGDLHRFPAVHRSATDLTSQRFAAPCARRDLGLVDLQDRDLARKELYQDQDADPRREAAASRPHGWFCQAFRLLVRLPLSGAAASALALSRRQATCRHNTITPH